MAGETKWTAGPWVCEDADRIVRGPDGRTIARGHLRGTRHELVEALANARLIAVAPELYEALDDLLCFYTVGAPRTSSRRLAVRDKARAALAKAQGK